MGLLSLPDPVDEVAARTVAAGVVVVCAGTLREECADVSRRLDRLVAAR